MRYFYLVFLLFSLASCEELIDIEEIEGPCTIQLKDGKSIFAEKGFELLKSTGTITYRDEKGKLWSIAADEYESYSCGN